MGDRDLDGDETRTIAPLFVSAERKPSPNLDEHCEPSEGTGSEELLTAHLKRQVSDLSPDDEDAVSSLRLDHPSLFEESRARFELQGVLGRGGTSQVFAAYDHDLRREVAIKVVRRSSDGQREQLAREARLTASLAHPHVPPVFDVGQANGDYYLALPRIRGTSLRKRIREARRTGASSALSTAKLVEVLLKVCDALAYAHDRRVIHKDVKPDNIMIGDFGEVMLVDWGAAATLDEPSVPEVVVGTLAYMAPEQARAWPHGPHFDVYALGATLFHALLLRKPIVESDVSVYLERKLSGALDLPTPAELARVPRRLVAIAMRAMHAQQSERYQSIPEMAEDLRDFISGGRKWSAPIVEETFSDGALGERWLPVEPRSFLVRESSETSELRELVSQANEGALLFYRERLSGGVAIEFDARMDASGRPGDISCIFTEDDVFSDAGARFPHQGRRTYCFQVGALSNHLVGIFRDFHQPLSSRAHSVQAGQTVRVRAEVDGQMLRLLVDGELMAEYEERVPLRSGYIALYAYYPGKCFSQVRIRQRGLPETVSPLSVGDAFFARSDFEEALVEYQRVELGQGNPELVAHARYQRGVCLLRLGRIEEAHEMWSALEGHAWLMRILLHRAELAFESGDHDEVCQFLGVALIDASFKKRAIQLWTELVERLIDRDDSPLVDYMQIRETHFKEEATTRSLVARALLALGQFSVVAQDYPEERIEYCDALLALGRFDEIIEKHADMTGLVDATLVRQGRLDQVSDNVRSRPAVLLAQGKLKEALGLSELPQYALANGRYSDVIRASRPGSIEQATALIRSEAVDEAQFQNHPLTWLTLGDSKSAEQAARTLQMKVRVLHYQSLEAFFEGRDWDFREKVWQARRLPMSRAWEDMWCERFILIPTCEELGGQRDALRTSLEQVYAHMKFYWAQRAYYVAAYLLGHVSEEEFLAQPACGSAAARLFLARAVQADVSGRATEAMRQYESFLSCPVREYFLDSVFLNPGPSYFAETRLSQLKAASDG